MVCLKVVSIARKWQLCGFISEFLPPTFDFLEGCMAMFFAIFPAAFGNLPWHPISSHMSTCHLLLTCEVFHIFTFFSTYLSHILFHFPRIFPIFIQYFRAIPVFAKIGKYFSPFSTYFQNFQGDRSVFFFSSAAERIRNPSQQSRECLGWARIFGGGEDSGAAVEVCAGSWWDITSWWVFYPIIYRFSTCFNHPRWRRISHRHFKSKHVDFTGIYR